MSDKLPALQFYPGDWRKDPGIRALTAIERYVWFEMLLVMHEADPRGYFALNGEPYPFGAFASSIGVKSSKVTSTVSKLNQFGISSRNDRGLVFSRRMVRDEEIRKSRKHSGSLGGNPILVNQNSKSRLTHSQPNPNQSLNQIPTPSSSSSISSSYSNKITPNGVIPPTPQKGEGKKSKAEVEIIFPASWNDNHKQCFTRWKEYRAEIRKPLKSKSFQAQVNAYSDDPDLFMRLVERAIVNGWQGLNGHVPFESLQVASAPLRFEKKSLGEIQLEKHKIIYEQIKAEEENEEKRNV